MWLDAFKNVVVEGAAGFIPGAGTLTNWYLKPKQNDTTGTATSSGLAFAKGNGKGLLGLGYDLLSSEIATGSSQPKPPTMPVASYTEMRFSGKVTSISEPTIVGPFYIPGAFDESGLTGNLTPFNYPAYNEPMGMAALLNTPSAVIQFSENTNTSFNTDNQDGCPSDVDTEIIMTFDLKMKLDEELMTVLNHTLDFDMDRTATYVGFEVDVKVPDNPMPNLGAFTGLTDYEVSESEQNMFVNLDFNQNGDRVLKYSSKWIPLDIVNQYVYSIKREEIFNFSEWANQPPAGSNCNEPNSSNHYSFDFDYIIERVKLKVVHDMYFDQIGSNGDQVNQLQIFTYDVYNPSENINLFNTSPTNWDQVSPGQFGLYQPGILELNNQIIGPSSDVVTELDNGILYVRAEELNVTGFVQVQNGYKLKLEALSQVRLSPEGRLGTNVHIAIKRDYYNLPVFQYADNLEVSSFCSNSGEYQADIPSQSLMQRLVNSAQAIENIEEVENPRMTNLIRLFPNPARDLLTLSSSHLDMSSATIHDLSGRILKQENLPDQTRQYQMNLSGIAPGTYLVRVDCGDEVFSEKLVVGK